MELIPILSTIILVATISTFLLAVGAYILYKVRERKGQAAVTPQPAEVKAEIVTPAAASGQKPVQEPAKVVPQPIYIETQPTPSFQRQPIIIQQPAQAPSQPRFTPQPQPYAASRRPYATTQAGTGYASAAEGAAQQPAERAFRDSKFLKYTSEGYIPTKEDKEPGALKWR